MADPNITRETIQTTTLGSETPLSHIGTYCNSYLSRMELNASVQEGNTQHCVQLNLTYEAARDLLRELKLRVPEETS